MSNTIESRRRKQKIRNSLKALAKREKLGAKKQAKLSELKPPAEPSSVNSNAGYS
jgi:hypothetical protein